MISGLEELLAQKKSELFRHASDLMGYAHTLRQRFVERYGVDAWLYSLAGSRDFTAAASDRDVAAQAMERIYQWATTVVGGSERQKANRELIELARKAREASLRIPMLERDVADCEARFVHHKTQLKRTLARSKPLRQ